MTFAHDGVEQVLKVHQPIDHTRHHRGGSTALARILAVVGFACPPHKVVVGQKHGASGFQVFQLLGKAERQPGEPLH